jgi:aminoglycoside phosphotransferase (APT) family kinase protein
MLSAADRAIVKRDPALPGLSLMLDADALAARLGLPSLEHAYLRYKPATSCVAAFVPDEQSPPFAVMAYSHSRFEVIRRRSEWLKAATPAELLEDACMVRVPLALDRGLKGASRLASPDGAGKLLRRLAQLPAEAGAAATILRYKPGRRLVARLDSEGRPVALVKAYSADVFAIAMVGAIAAAALGGPQVLGLDPGRHIIATAWIDGRPLCPAERDHVDRAAIREVGTRLAEVHAARFRPPLRQGRKSEQARVLEHLAAVRTLDPALAREVEPLAQRIADGLNHKAGDACLVHGDFSADQVLLAFSGPVIVDWDSVASGDPACDLATFFARLDAQALDGIVTAGEAEAAQASVAEGYSGQAGGLPERLRIQHAAALLALMAEGFRLRRPGWPQRAEGLLKRAEGLLAVPSRSRRSGVGTIPHLAAALDIDVMRERLSGLLEAPAGELDLAEPELMRLKPGSRALVRYRAAISGDPLDLVGKIRAKGADRRTPVLHEALRAAGLDGEAHHGVGVPGSHGVVAEMHLWLQDAVPGRMAADFLLPGGDTTPSARAGVALARLHRTSVPTDRTWTFAQETEVLEQALFAAQKALPGEAGRIASIAGKARLLISSLAPGPVTGLHRDYYPDQVLIDGERAWLLDLDLYALGDPAIDLGNYVAHIAELALRRHGDAAALDEHAAAFLQAYGGHVPLPDGLRVKMMKVFSLCRHIHISMRIKSRRDSTLPLIGICETWLDNLLDVVAARVGAALTAGNPAARHVEPPLHLPQCQEAGVRRQRLAVEPRGPGLAGHR